MSAEVTRLGGGFIALVGGALVAFFLVTAARSSDPMYWILVSSPVVFSVALSVTGVLLARGRLVPDKFVKRLLGWTVIGVVVLSLLGAWLFFFAVVYLEQPMLDPPVALINIIIFGALVGLLVGVYDARGRLAHESLALRERELLKQNQQLDEFAGVVTHDLRNPLNVAVGRLELAREEADSDHLDQVADALARMDVLIVDLLTLAREGRTVDEFRYVPLRGVIEEAWSTVASSRGTLRLDGDLGVVSCDRSRLRQLLENLFRNSVEHARTDATVTVGQLDEGFYVADDGPGIPAERRGEVFELGYSTNENGTGFGLTIVRSIAEAHGWVVDVVESDNGGVRFEFSGVVMGE